MIKIDGVKFRNIENEYNRKDDAFHEDSDLMTEMSDIIDKLPIHERRLIILYAEYGSYRKMAKIFNCHWTTIHKQIKKIKQKIKTV